MARVEMGERNWYLELNTMTTVLFGVREFVRMMSIVGLNLFLYFHCICKEVDGLSMKFGATVH